MAVVIGRGRGLGYSLAAALADDGAAVGLLDILPEVDETARAPDLLRLPVLRPPGAGTRPRSAVLVSSMSAQIVNVPQFQASYQASKAAVSMLAQALGVEWAPRGVRVNAIGGRRT